ncbi:cytochrome c [bacterium]|nr:cytochrome c [bacterium]
MKKFDLNFGGKKMFTSSFHSSIFNALKARSAHLLSLGATLLILSGCMKEPFTGPEKLGGTWVSAKQLNQGWETYNNYCMQCHGMDGGGNGPAAQGMVPQPRNFKQGLYKFGTVTMGELPTDEDLKRIIRHGLNGTPMLPWDISDERLMAVIQYIKTFSPEWKKNSSGTSVVFQPDPWGPELASEAILQGKKVYHGLAQCYTCHPSYATLDEVSAASKELTDTETEELRENPHLSLNQGSSYGHSYMPPDLTRHHIRSARTREDIYKRLVVGVNGTTMPAWRGMLSLTGDKEEDEKNLWALAYYVESLQKLKWNWKARQEFFKSLNQNRSMAR